MQASTNTNRDPARLASVASNAPDSSRLGGFIARFNQLPVHVRWLSLLVLATLIAGLILLIFDQAQNVALPETKSSSSVDINNLLGQPQQCNEGPTALTPQSPSVGLQNPAQGVGPSTGDGLQGSPSAGPCASTLAPNAAPGQ